MDVIRIYDKTIYTNECALSRQRLAIDARAFAKYRDYHVFPLKNRKHFMRNLSASKAS